MFGVVIPRWSRGWWPSMLVWKELKARDVVLECSWYIVLAILEPIHQEHKRGGGYWDPHGDLAWHWSETNDFFGQSRWFKTRNIKKTYEQNLGLPRKRQLLQLAPETHNTLQKYKMVWIVFAFSICLVKVKVKQCQHLVGKKTGHPGWWHPTKSSLFLQCGAPQWCLLVINPTNYSY